MEKTNFKIGLTCLLLAAGIAAGAFGAHYLASRVSESDLKIYDKAIFYWMINSLGLLIICNSPQKIKSSAILPKIFLLLVGSMLVFSGSLITLVISQIRWLGAITPIGGLGMIVAWTVLGIHFMRSEH